MRIRLLYQLELFDEKGNLIKDSGEIPSRSFVLQFLQHIQVAILDSSTNMKDTGGVTSSIDAPAASGSSFMQANASASTTTFGIQVGTGTTAPTNSDNKLQTQIAHGMGTGQLVYGTTVLTLPSVVGANVDFVVQRTFANSSGATITVREVGLVITSYSTPTGIYHRLLAIRDLSTIGVPHGKTLLVKYTLRTTT